MVIKNIFKPSKLFLMWKDSDGSRHKVGILEEERFQYLEETDSELIKAKEKGFNGFPAFKLETRTHLNPLPVFIRRSPPKDRRDYDTFLKAFCLNPESKDVKEISDYTLLGYTGAYVPGNPFHLLNPFIGITSKFEFVMQVAGAHLNYLGDTTQNKKKNLANKPLIPLIDTKNPADPENAIKLNLEDQRFGYVPRGLNKFFKAWIKDKRNINITINRINGDIDHHYAYAFVSVGEHQVTTK